MAAPPTLETARLILRPVGMADAPAVQRLFPQWDVVRYLDAGVPWPYPDNGAERHLRDLVLPRTERGEGWCWAIRPKSAPQPLIGLVDLRLGEDDNRGFWLDPAWRRRGLMREAADAVTDYWFDVLRQPVLRVPKATENEASRRISARQGMRVIETGERDYVGGRLPYELWEITAREWRARRTGA